MIPVVIGTNPERGAWLRDCLKSVRSTTKHRRVLIHRTGGYEIAALRTGCAKFKRFLYLQDSCEILTPEFWNIIDTTPDAWLFGPPHMYLGVFTSRTLAPAIADAPEMDKSLSIHWEGELGMRIQQHALWPDVIDQNGHHAERHGRLNLVLQSEHARKWKGNWGQT